MKKLFHAFWSTEETTFLSEIGIGGPNNLLIVPASDTARLATARAVFEAKRKRLAERRALSREDEEVASSLKHLVNGTRPPSIPPIPKVTQPVVAAPEPEKKLTRPPNPGQISVRKR